MHKIDINCDLGEGNSLADCDRDAQIMPYISRCNIACGGHAGNRLTMQQSINNALVNKLAIGAHPGYPDPENFGRLSLPIEIRELCDSIAEQIHRLQGVAREFQVELDHIKLHGALYNDAECSPELAEQITQFLVEEFPPLKIMGLANAEMQAATRRHQHPFIREGFMDRRYLSERKLVPRSQEGAVITDFDQCFEQMLCLAQELPFKSYNGEPLRFSVDSICLHGDNPEAPSIARRLAQQLEARGVQVCP